MMMIIITANQQQSLMTPDTKILPTDHDMAGTIRENNSNEAKLILKPKQFFKLLEISNALWTAIVK